MAKALSGIETVGSTLSPAYSLRALWILRLALGNLILLGSIITTLGVSWDIQWHSFVGRDRTLIPPHEMMLGGILLSGCVALVVVCLETAWTRRNPLLANYSTNFANFFHSGLGAYIAGFAALDAAIAFPLDAYWHALYGIDVSIWAPFHVMILGGAALIPLGATYMLVSAARLATRSGDHKTARLGYLSAIIALGTTMAVFTYLLADSVGSQGMIGLGGDVVVNVFPFLAGLLVAGLLVAAKYAIPWRWAATAVLLVYLAFGVLFMIFVPPATNYLLVLEHLSYRRHIGGFAYLSIVTLQAWWLTPIIVAPLIDLFFRRAQHKAWSITKLTTIFALISLIACLPAAPLDPIFFLGLAVNVGVIGGVLSLLLGLVGTLAGTWFGRHLGESMQQIEGAA